VSRPSLRQTRRIAERIAGALRLRGHEPDVRDARTDAPSSLSGYRGAVLAASVHRGEHEPEMIAFVRRHRAELEGLRTALVTVSLAEAGVEDPARRPEERAAAMRDVTGLVERFLEETSWHPDTIHRAAGALAYTQYGVLTRVIMQLIALRAGATTDASKDHELTDWGAVDAFAAQLFESP
jgi:menaquinone-dependent protoporphyrinogen oxidase